MTSSEKIPNPFTESELPEAPMPIGNYIEVGGQNPLVTGLSVSMEGPRDGWLVCVATVSREGAWSNMIGWKSRSVAMALEMVAVLARNYPNVSRLTVELIPPLPRDPVTGEAHDNT